MSSRVLIAGSIPVLLMSLWCQAAPDAIIVGDDLPSPLPIAGKKIAMVFDDGPLPGTTATLLEALKKNGMKATFSVVGKNVQANPDLARRIVEDGHELANETWSHPNLSALTPDQILGELNKAEEMIYITTGVRARYFRPPDGNLSPEIADLIKSQGYEILLPTFDSGDWRSPPPGAVRKAILDGVTPGAIILAHDSFPKSVAEMPGILTELSKRGFHSTTVSQLREEALARN